VSSLVNQATKLLAGRERPFVHARSLELAPQPGSPVRKLPDPPHPDDNLSFCSGHSQAAFVMAAASGTAASLRGYDLAPAVWAGGMSVAVAVAWLRIAADRHYLSDVLAGGVIGSAIGVLLPLGFHGRAERLTAGTTPATAPPPTTQAFTVGGVF
jgi:membrane-associated phospholipid phosphatase